MNNEARQDDSYLLSQYTETLILRIAEDNSQVNC